MQHIKDATHKQALLRNSQKKIKEQIKEGWRSRPKRTKDEKMQDQPRSEPSPPKLPEGKLNLKQKTFRITEPLVTSSPKKKQKTIKPQHLKCMKVLTQTCLEQQSKR